MVSKAAISKALGGRILAKVQGYWVVTLGFSHWTIGASLTDTEIRLLDLPKDDDKTPIARYRCHTCGCEDSQFFSSEAQPYCNTCLGTHIDILGRCIRVQPKALAITDGTNSYPSVKALADALGKSYQEVSSAVWKVLRGKRKSYLGKQWAPLITKEINESSK